MAQGVVRTAQFIQSSFLPAVVGACVKFGGYDSGQNRALEDSGVFTEPKIVLASGEADVYAGIEEKGTRRKWNHRVFAGARSKRSTRPPRFRKRRRA